MVQGLVKLAQLLNAVGHAFLHELKALWFFVFFAVYFQERLIVGLDDIDSQAGPLGALGVEASPTVLIVAADGIAHCTSTYSTR